MGGSGSKGTQLSTLAAGGYGLADFLHMIFLMVSFGVTPGPKKPW